MKALTIWQPYAGLIAAGIKTIETRGWPAPKNLIGQRVAIHAAKKWDTARVADWDRVTRWLWDRGIYTAEEMKRIIDLTGPLATGKVLSIATLAECSLMEVAPNETEEQFGWFATRRYGWRFAENQRLQFPPTVAGMQGVWEWAIEPKEVEATA